MAGGPVPPRASASRTDRHRIALPVLGLWTALVPYLARPLGLEVDVDAMIEIVDHVVPGLLVALFGGWLARGSRAARALPADLIASAVCALAGFWVLATHVPLLADAAAGREPWAAALWHVGTGPLIIVLGFAVALRSGPADDRGT